MKVSLDISERIAGIRLINEGGDALTLVGLKGAMELIKLFTITEEEQTKVGFKEETTEDENGVKSRRVTWEDEKYSKEFNFSKEQRQVLDDLVEAKDTGKKFSMADGVSLVSLIDKLQ